MSSDGTYQIEIDHLNVKESGSRYAPDQETVEYLDVDNGQIIEALGRDDDGDLMRMCRLGLSEEAALELADQIRSVHAGTGRQGGDS
jgi:hypothetical protein